MPIGGYGQQIEGSPNQDLFKAMQQQQMLQNRQDATQGLMQSNGTTGNLGILGALIGGIMNKRQGDKLAQGESDIQRMIAEQQGQEQQRLSEVAKAKEIKELERKDFEWNRENQAKIKAAAASKEGTGIMQNLASKGLSPGTPEWNNQMDAFLSKKTGTTVNVGDKGSEFEVGKIPDGYAMVRNAQGQPQFVKVEGSPQQAKEKDIELAKKAKIDTELAGFNDLNPVIDKVLDEAGPMTTGFIGNLSKAVPGTPAHDMAKNLETIQSDQALTRLVKLKEGGGTLGAVSEKELGLLMAARRNLEQSQSEEQFKENLQAYKDIRKRAMSRIGGAYKAKYGEMPEGFQSLENKEKKQGGQIMVDANGNRARVFPDGSFEEL